MEHSHLPRRLEIVQTYVLDVDSYHRWILIHICAILIPFLLLCMHTVHFHGEDTYRLQHDIETAIPRPVPVPSMWVDYQPLKCGSSYVPVGLIREGMFETFILNFPWNTQITVLLLLYNSLISFTVLQMSLLNVSLKRCKLLNILMFLVLVTLYSILVYLAIDGTLSTAYVSVMNNFLAWLASNIVQLDLNSDVKDYITTHPYTLGRYPPFLLTHEFRYCGEDVVFECKYDVTSYLDIEPGYVTTWWRKNGVSIDPNDRMYINESIENIDNDSRDHNLRRYLIVSRLTIEVIEEEDYGLYVCEYTNPLPGRVRVAYYNKLNNHNCMCKSITNPQPMTPHPQCGCQPVSQDKAENRSLLKRTVCFSEFDLKPFATATKTVHIHPGGILATAASYRTVSNMSDIKVDVTFEGNSDRKGSTECCSIFIKIYWALFRTGRFLDLPISRLLGQHCQNSTNHIAIVKSSCICVDSFGIRDYSFYRDHFNTTIGKYEEIEIKHPVSLVIQQRDNASKPLVDSFSFCNKDDLWLCWCVEIVLDNSIYIFYTYDVFILIGFIIVVLSTSSVETVSNVLIAKPLWKFFFLNSGYMLPFTAVQGPDVYLTNNNEQSVSASFDIYLSYSEDDIYDMEVARHVKILLKAADLTVFDSVQDILPGHLVSHESANAIKNSGCVVIIASKTYVNDNFKKMEFVAIQDVIVSRGSAPKDCLLIVQVEDCDIVGLHRVPCIHVPTGLKETFSLDQSSINRFSEWIRATRTVSLNEITVASKLSVSGFNVMSVLFIIGLMYLGAKSPILQNMTQFPDETDVASVD